MSYLIGKWYVMKYDGTLEPCQNYSTARYLVKNGMAEAIVDITRELISK